MSFEFVTEPAYWDLVVHQGASFTRTLEFETSIDDYEFRGQIRPSHESEDVLASFSFTKVDSNTLGMALIPGTTEQLPVGNAVYDVEAFTFGDAFVVRLFEGCVSVTPEVTR